MTDEELIEQLKTAADYGSPHGRILRLAAERLEALLDGDIPVPKGTYLPSAFMYGGPPYDHEVTLMQDGYMCVGTATKRREAVRKAAALIARLKRDGHPPGDYALRGAYVPEDPEAPPELDSDLDAAASGRFPVLTPRPGMEDDDETP